MSRCVRGGVISSERAKSLTAHHVPNCRCPKSFPPHQCHTVRESRLKKGGNLIPDTRVTWASYIDISSQVRAVREVLLLSQSPMNLSSRLDTLISSSTCVLLKDATIQISSIAKYSQVQAKSAYRCLWWRWSIICWWWAMQDWLHKDHSIHYEMEIPSWKQPHTFLKVLRSHLTPWILAACCWKRRENDAFSSRCHLFEGYAAVVLFCYLFFGGSPNPKSQPQTLSSQDTTPPRSCSNRPAFTRSWPDEANFSCGCCFSSSICSIEVTSRPLKGGGVGRGDAGWFTSKKKENIPHPKKMVSLRQALLFLDCESCEILTEWGGHLYPTPWKTRAGSNLWLVVPRENPLEMYWPIDPVTVQM